jgi:hypothetical protein
MLQFSKLDIIRFLHVWKFNPTVLELDFRADKVFVLPRRAPHIIDTLQRQSLSLMSNAQKTTPLSKNIASIVE